MGKVKHSTIIYILVSLLVFMLITVVSSAMTLAAFADSGAGSDSHALLVEIAVDFGTVPLETAPGAIIPPISRKEVYCLKPSSRVTKKDLKRYGGADRYFQIYKIKRGDRVYERINGRSYRQNPDIALEDLRYIRALYYDFNGKVRSGEIVVNRSIAGDTLAVFRDLYKVKYQIRKMCLIDDYFPESKTSGGKGSAPAANTAASNTAATNADTASMNDDNTSGFNYRTVAGSGSISMHGYGRAIDINPLENPWCPGGAVYYNQRRSAEYANRANRRPHMIYADSEVTKIFSRHGFRWLGSTATRDYQHFEK